MPNDQDVLRSRVKTTGITETTFIIGDLTYRMFDVGGQRSERKKWIHCFENVTTILFLVAISEYDQLLFEDETVNRMQEALTLFDSICNSRWFIKTSIILFLNKIDRFKEKLPVSPMKNYFPDYEGGDDYAAACDYILNRFVSLNQHETKQIYTHFTCATDTTQIRFVMAAVNGMYIPDSMNFTASFSFSCADNLSRHYHPGEPTSLRSDLVSTLFFGYPYHVIIARFLPYEQCPRQSHEKKPRLLRKKRCCRFYVFGSLILPHLDFLSFYPSRRTTLDTTSHIIIAI